MSFRFLSHKLTREEGAAAVEFALLLPLLTLILLGIIMFGLIFNYYLEITHAAREGARWAALRAPFSGSGGVDEKARNAAPGLEPDRVTVTMSSNVPSSGATSDDQGEPVTVSVQYDITATRSLFGTLFEFLPATIMSEATQRVE